MEGRTDQKTDQKVVDVAVQLGWDILGYPQSKKITVLVHTPPGKLTWNLKFTSK